MYEAIECEIESLEKEMLKGFSEEELQESTNILNE